MDKLLHKVADLQLPERSAVEAILGHSLRDDQQLYIVAINSSAEPAPALRLQAWNELEAIIAEARHNVSESGVSPAELERTIDDACHEIRYGK